MIRVIRIVGESFDIDTKQETPKMIVLSNGHREVSVPVDDEAARAIVNMLLEELSDKPIQEDKDPVQPKSRGNGKPKPRAPKKIEFSPEDGPGNEYDDPAT